MLAGPKISLTKNCVLIRIKASGELEAEESDYLKRVSNLPGNLEHGIDMLRSGLANSRHEAVAALFARLAYFAGQSSKSEDKASLWIGATRVSLGLAGFRDDEAKTEARKLVSLYEDQNERVPVNWEG